MGKKKRCWHCGASMMEHRHTLNRALVEGLFRLYGHRRPMNLRVLGLNRSQWDNFQKLRYWELVRKFIDEDGRRKGGMWTMTERGIDFILGRAKVPRHVRTYRGERVDYEGEEVGVTDIHPGYKDRLDYAREAVAAIAAGDQRTLW